MEFHRIRLLFGVMLAFSFPHAALSQSQFGLTVTAPDSVIVSNNITYSINVTNRGSAAGLISVVNSFSPSLQFVNWSSNQNVTATVSQGRAEFTFTQFPPTTNEVLIVRLRANQVGDVTNFVAVTLGSSSVFASTNLETRVTRTPGNADVAVIITPRYSSTPFVNDWVALTVGLFNRGGGTVSGIFLTNRLTNAIVRDYRPSGGGTISQGGARLVLNVGSLAAGQTTNYHLTVQPTRTTNVSLISNFRSSGDADTNSDNNVASLPIPVRPSGPTSLFRTEVASVQVFDPQTGFMDQRITVQNIGTNVAPNARVILSNVSYRVSNAVGTNNGHPFVLHAAPIQTNETVEMLLEYFIPDREPRQSPRLIAYSTTETAPAALTNGTYAEFSHVVWREPFGSMTETNLVLIFNSDPGARYELQYSSHINFTNALRALPLLVAPANNMVFIDYGPPKTISRPLRQVTITTNELPVTDSTGTNIVAFTNVYVTNLNMRFYRAMKIP